MVSYFPFIIVFYSYNIAVKNDLLIFVTMRYQGRFWRAALVFQEVTLMDGYLCLGKRRRTPMTLSGGSRVFVILGIASVSALNTPRASLLAGLFVLLV